MDIEWSHVKILDYIRGLTHPFPGAYFETSFGTLHVWRALLGCYNPEALPGQILEISESGLLVGTGSGFSIWLQNGFGS